MSEPRVHGQGVKYIARGRCGDPVVLESRVEAVQLADHCRGISWNGWTYVLCSCTACTRASDQVRLSPQAKATSRQVVGEWRSQNAVPAFSVTPIVELLSWCGTSTAIGTPQVSVLLSLECVMPTAVLVGSKRPSVLNECCARSCALQEPALHSLQSMLLAVICTSSTFGFSQFRHARVLTGSATEGGSSACRAGPDQPTARCQVGANN
jgi:hypothetical protein